MTKVQWVGAEGLEEYHGFDGDTPLNLVAGETADVSKEKAAQLAADFGHLVKVDGKAAAAAPAQAVGPLGTLNAKDAARKVAELTAEELDLIPASEKRTGVVRAIERRRQELADQAGPEEPAE